ncbi:MAG: hypothetical protein EA377_07650 [Phycisphaerales bacterium]|nr:MAG: hypothetical protein EA377_07650 [Phycisphaerales bacterium]
MHLLLPALLAGCLVGGGLLLLARPAPQMTADEVRREIIGLLLHKSRTPGLEDGGQLGPWWVAARSVDPETDEFLNFRMRSGSLRLAADRAALRIYPENDAIDFLLTGVVLTVLPDGPIDRRGESYLLDLDQYVLGPFPYRMKILSDETMEGDDPILPSLARVQDD